jgi:hypothetical protein
MHSKKYFPRPQRTFEWFQATADIGAMKNIYGRFCLDTFSNQNQHELHPAQIILFPCRYGNNVGSEDHASGWRACSTLMCGAKGCRIGYQYHHMNISWEGIRNAFLANRFLSPMLFNSLRPGERHRKFLKIPKLGNDMPCR